MKCIQKWVEPKEIVNKIDWKETWKDIDKFKEGNCTSSEKSRNWVFRIKYLNEALPTMDKLNQRNPELYETNICIACIEEAETQDHLATCTIYQNIWSRLESEISEELYRKIEKNNS